MNETKEQRQIRLEKKREQTRSSLANKTEEQRQIRLEKKRKQTRSSRTNETEEQRQLRLEKERERTRSSRTNETEEQLRIRLKQQRKRSEMNRADKKISKRTFDNSDIQQQSNSIRPSWPEPIPRHLKETRLQQFLQQMSMSALAEATCAVCNIRTPAKDSKKIATSKIPNIHLLKVSEELKDLIINIQLPSLQHSRRDTEISANNNNIKITEHAKSNT